MKHKKRLAIIFLLLGLSSCGPRQAPDYQLIRHNAQLTDFDESDMSYLDAIQKHQTTRAQNRKSEQEKKLNTLIRDMEFKDESIMDRNSQLRYTAPSSQGLIHLGVKYNNKGINLIDVWK